MYAVLDRSTPVGLPVRPEEATVVLEPAGGQVTGHRSQDIYIYLNVTYDTLQVTHEKLHVTVDR